MTKKMYMRCQTHSKKNISKLYFLLKELTKKYNFVFYCVCLPKKIKKYTVLKSPNGDKKSKDQFEIRLYNFLIILLYNSNLLNNILKNILYFFKPNILVKISHTIK
uniref:Ribosomal protein S10 n=1 Tax=Vischeria stellata TaxID=1104407 RepID=A0A481XJ16_9STRA|nr:ribosomal protein S10 [Vischeria stellata]QBK36849.1 ribosomal protein S10 [Vischeria stellata]